MREADDGAIPSDAGASGVLPGVFPVAEDGGLGVMRWAGSRLS